MASVEYGIEVDLAGRIVRERGFSGRVVELRYDRAGRCIEVVNGRRKRTRLTRDALGRIVGRGGPRGRHLLPGDVVANDPGVEPARERPRARLLRGQERVVLDPELELGLRGYDPDRRDEHEGEGERACESVTHAHSIGRQRAEPLPLAGTETGLQPTSSASAASKTSLWRSTSAAVVAGHMSAML